MQYALLSQSQVNQYQDSINEYAIDPNIIVRFV